jgi:hypothetical protein
MCLEVWRERRVEGKWGKERRGEEREGEWLPLPLVRIF